MDKSQLQIILSQLDGFESPDPDREQYTTPPSIAAGMLKRVDLTLDDTAQIIDLGAGTGVLTIGAGLLGFTAHGYEIDGDALAVARKNLATVEDDHGEVPVTFEEAAIEEINATADAVIMNPPFGIKQEDRNLDFLEVAFSTADQVFALLHRSKAKERQTRQFIKEFASHHGTETSILASYTLRLPKTMRHHTQQQARTETDLYYFTR